MTAVELILLSGSDEARDSGMFSKALDSSLDQLLWIVAVAERMHPDWIRELGRVARILPSERQWFNDLAAALERFAS